MSDPSKTRSRPERRKKKRTALARGVLARYGTMDVIMIDVSDGGARIEHFTQLNVGRKTRFRFDWQNETIETEAEVRACKVHRFANEEEGATTVFQSGLFFTDYVGDAAAKIREMVSVLVARSLAEQVANARGIGPVMERNMPVFRAGLVTSSGVEASDDKNVRIPKTQIVVDRGYVRCALSGRRWTKKWSRNSDQPEEGFTVPATEPADHVDQLCEMYEKADEEGRKLIQLLARLSVEKGQETPEPRP